MACIAEDTSRYELSSRLNGANGDVELTKCDEESISSSLYSVMSFDDLSLKPEFLRAIKVMGFNKPSKIQGMVLPILLQNPPVNIMAQSQSGTGKTAAFLLAALMRVDPSKHYPQVCAFLRLTIILLTHVLSYLISLYLDLSIIGGLLIRC